MRVCVCVCVLCASCRLIFVFPARPDTIVKCKTSKCRTKITLLVENGASEKQRGGGSSSGSLDTLGALQSNNIFGLQPGTTLSSMLTVPQMRTLLDVPPKDEDAAPQKSKKPKAVPRGEQWFDAEQGVMQFSLPLVPVKEESSSSDEDEEDGFV